MAWSCARTTKTTELTQPNGCSGLGPRLHLWVRKSARLDHRLTRFAAPWLLWFCLGCGCCFRLLNFYLSSPLANMRRPQVSRPYSSSTRPPFASLHHLPPRSHLPTSFQTASSSELQELQLWQRLTMPMPSFADSLGSSHTGSLRLPWDAWRKYGNGREFQVYGSCCVQYCSEGLQGPRLQTSADFVKAMGRMT